MPLSQGKHCRCRAFVSLFQLSFLCRMDGHKEKQAVRKLSEAVLAEGWKLFVKPGAHQGLFHKRPWWP